MPKNSSSKTGRGHQLSVRHIVRDLLIAIIFAGTGIFILTYQPSPTNVIDLDIGDVAHEDILAPSQFNYVSELETEAGREKARNSIELFYSPPDLKIARQQVNRLRKIFDYLDAVRADPYGSLAEKSEWIAAIPDLSLSDIVVDQILIMNDQAWDEAKLEALTILDQAMRTEIKENQVSTTRRQLPTMVALDTPDEQASVIVAITEDLIEPNTFPDEARTEAARQAAVEQVEEAVIPYEENELIIKKGQIVGAKEVEALQALNSQQPTFSWPQNFFAPAVLILLTTIIISVYLVQYTPRILIDEKRLILLAFLLLAFIAIAKFMIPNASVITYLYPIATLSMMIAILINAQLAFIVTTIMAFLAGYIAIENAQMIVIYLILSGWTGVLALGKSQRINTLLWASVYVGVVNVGTILVFNLTTNPLELPDIGTLLLMGLLSGILSAGLATIGLFAVGNLMAITTSIQLMELARPTHPLLRQLLLKAPGTYHHSLMVSNMGEQAAERIGANALLVRVMAYYHDVGKMQRPYFFIENQPHGINVHEKLDPQISAQIIISHTKDGLDLANKYRLPPSIKAGIAQHHGTSLQKYFYHQALEAAKGKNIEVDEANFRYPGPKPQNKENGILMLADISESTVRALKPASAEEIDEIVQKLIADKLDSGELDECELTIADLHDIRTAFVDILQGVHHPRIKYPEQTKAEQEATTGTETEQAGQEPATPENSTEKTAPAPAPTPLSFQALADPQSRPTKLVRQE